MYKVLILIVGLFCGSFVVGCGSTPTKAPDCPKTIPCKCCKWCCNCENCKCFECDKGNCCKKE